MAKTEASRAGHRDGVAAVDRALAIVEALEAGAQPLSLADLARATGMYKSTLLRLLASLERNALVVHRSDQRYAIGPFALHLGQAFETTYHLKECVVPVLEWLIEQGTESPSFHVRHDAETRHCVFRIDSKHSTLDRVRVGDLFPIRQGAPGKVIRAFSKGLPAARDAGLTYTSFGERDPACAAVASPVFGPGGELMGAVSLSGPLERFTHPAVKKMSRLLLIAAETATRSLGGTWPATGATRRVAQPVKSAGGKRNPNA